MEGKSVLSGSPRLCTHAYICIRFRPLLLTARKVLVLLVDHERRGQDRTGEESVGWAIWGGTIGLGAMEQDQKAEEHLGVWDTGMPARWLGWRGRGAT